MFVAIASSRALGTRTSDPPPPSRKRARRGASGPCASLPETSLRRARKIEPLVLRGRANDVRLVRAHPLPRRAQRRIVAGVHVERHPAEQELLCTFDRLVVLLQLHIRDDFGTLRDSGDILEAHL